VNSGDSVVWINQTDAEIIVFLPRKVKDTNPAVIPIAGNASGGITAGTDTDVYFYQVFCSETNSFAEGNSDPIIIID